MGTLNKTWASVLLRAVVSVSRWRCGRLHRRLLLGQRTVRRPSRHRSVLGPQPPTVRKHTHTVDLIETILDFEWQNVQLISHIYRCSPAETLQSGWREDKPTSVQKYRYCTSHHISVLKARFQTSTSAVSRNYFTWQRTIFTLLQTEKALKHNHDFNSLLHKDIVE